MDTATRRRTYMKRLFFAAGLFTALASTHCFGQSLRMQANIPFNFQIGTVSMPAGEYVLNQSGSMLTVRNKSGKQTVFSLTGPGRDRDHTATSTLAFRQYGDKHFLATIWNQDLSHAYALPKSKWEKELSHGPQVSLCNPTAPA